MCGQAFAGPAKPWFAVGGGFDTHSMSDVNADIDNLNAAIFPLRMDNVTSGFAFGAALGVDITSQVSLSAHYDRLLASTDVGDATGSIKYDFPANVFGARVQYLRPYGGRSSFGIGGGLGLVSAAGKVSLIVSGVGSVTGDVSGNGPVAEGFFCGDLRASDGFAIAPLLGYRYAKISETKVRGQIIYNADGSKYALDYSGLLARVMLKFGF
jgi:hypothetical protein